MVTLDNAVAKAAGVAGLGTSIATDGTTTVPTSSMSMPPYRGVNKVNELK